MRKYYFLNKGNASLSIYGYMGKTYLQLNHGFNNLIQLFTINLQYSKADHQLDWQV